jgi:hypothetical protein
MKQEAKRPSTSHAKDSSFPTLLMGWAQQGFDSFLATQRILMDFATNKSASAIKTVREGMSDPEHSPAAILTELAVEATANLTEAQRVLLNLAQQENEILMTGVKDQVGEYPTAAMVTDKMRRAIDTFIELQQDYLTTASKHAQKRLQATKAGKGPDAACLVDAAREAMDDFVRAQKKFLDIVAEDGTKAKAGKSEEHKKKTEVAKLAHEAANAFIEAQKKLLDLAGQQVNVNLQATSRAMEMMNSLRPHLMPNISGEGLKSFVNAEKNLISSIMKPEEGAKAAPKAAHAAKRAPRRRHPRATQAAQAGA